MKYEKSCGAIVLRKENKDTDEMYLLVIRQYAGGQISFPKGHVESDETEKMTAEREVFEETAVKIKIEHDFRETVKYSPMPGVEKEVVYFIAFTDIKKTLPRKNEIAEAFWIPLSEAEHQLSHDNDKRVLSEAVKFISADTAVANH